MCVYSVKVTRNYNKVMGPPTFLASKMAQAIYMASSGGFTSKVDVKTKKKKKKKREK